MTHIHPPTRSSFTDLCQFRLSGPSAVGQATDAREVVLVDPGLSILHRGDLQLRLAAIAENGVAALHALDESLYLLRLKLDLLRPLPEGDCLFSPRTGEKDVVGEGRLHERSDHVRSGMFSTGNRPPSPI